MLSLSSCYTPSNRGFYNCLPLLIGIKNYYVVIPLQIGASTTYNKNGVEKWDQMLLYPFKQGLLQLETFGDLVKVVEGCYTPSNRGFYNLQHRQQNQYMVCCYTPSNRGFYNVARVPLKRKKKKLLYPFKQGLLQHVDNCAVERELSCYTPSNRGFYNINRCILQRSDNVVIPLQIGASTTQRLKLPGKKKSVVIPLQIGASTTNQLQPSDLPH